MLGLGRIGKLIFSERARRILALVPLAWAPLQAASAIPDARTFDESAYSLGSNLSGLDSWKISADRGGDPAAFKIAAGTDGGGHVVLVNTTGLNTVMRSFDGDDDGTFEMRWRWKILDSTAHVCGGLATNASTARPSLEGVGCFAPGGVIKGSEEFPYSSTERWSAKRWYYCRHRVDWKRKKWAFYVAADSLRGLEHLVQTGDLPSVAASGSVRAVFFTQNGKGYAELDNLEWGPYHQWQAHTSTAYWSQAGNWSRNVVPDGNSPVVFDDASTQACILDQDVSVATLHMEKSFGGAISFGARTLTVTGSRADFTGLASWTASGGGVAFPGPSQVAFTSPSGTNGMPPIRHADGVLRLFGRKLSAYAFTQTGGQLDLGGYDLAVVTDLGVTGGGIKSLDGRTIWANRCLLAGASEANRIVLQTDSAAWFLSVKDTLVASYAQIARSNPIAKKGHAYNSVDAGGNVNWVFHNLPVIRTQPLGVNLEVGDEATFTVSVTPLGGTFFQWYRDGQAIPGATDSTYITTILKMADNGAKFTCEAWNDVGKAASAPAILSVAFPAPRVDPESASFSDSLTVYFGTSVPGGKLVYSFNGNTPVTSSQAVVRSSGTLQVKAVLGSDTSAASFGTYSKRSKLPPPAFAPADSVFEDSALVDFLAPPAGTAIHYTLDGSLPDTSSPSYSGAPVKLRVSATVRAVATRVGFLDSDPIAHSFIRDDEGPQALPAGGAFPETQQVTLVAKPGSDIRYTLDASTPDASSPKYAGPLTLDSSGTLKAVYVDAGGKTGKVTSFDFLLVPLAPVPNPAGGIFTDGTDISFSASTPKARVCYTLDGTIPDPAACRPIALGAAFHLDSNATLTAIALAGSGAWLRAGPKTVQKYVFTGGAPRVVAKGGKLGVGGGYTVANQGNASVTLRMLATDSLPTVKGFQAVSGFRVFPSDSGAPGLVLAGPEGGEKNLYRLDAAGRPVFQPTGGAADIKTPGVYFIGVDTVPPDIKVVREVPAGDSTEIAFAFAENTADLVLDLERSDSPRDGFTGLGFASGDTLVLRFRNPPGAIRPLSMVLSASDRTHYERFPARSPARHQLIQKLPSAASPAVFHIGEEEEQPWDLAGLPLASATPLTLSLLREKNGTGLAGMAWNAGTNEYRDLSGGEALVPGHAYWLRHTAPVHALVLPALSTSLQGAVDLPRFTLKPGWNFVANPGLETVYWPISRGDPRLATSDLKGLRGYDLSLHDFDFSDSLEPWRGYLAYYKGTRDTVIETLPAPYVPDPGAKRASVGFAFGMRLRGAPAVYLGAVPRGSEGVAVEDEPGLPSPRAGGPALWAQRGNARLGTDLVGWAPERLMRWTIAVSPGKDPGVTPELRVEGAPAEDGMEAWAVSRVRGLKFPLADGAAVPLPPSSADTLEILSGPPALMKAALAGVPAAVEEFAIEVVGTAGGAALRLRVKETVRLRWNVWSLSGRLLGNRSVTLGEGIYLLPAAPPGREAGLRVLEASWSGRDGSGRLARKLVIP